MPEIVAAHLEWVAKELAQWLGRPQSQAEIERRVAAALAACAREEFVPIPHDKVVKLVDVMLGRLKLEVPEKIYAETRQTIIDYFDIIDLRVPKDALERAAGEKA